MSNWWCRDSLTGFDRNYVQIVVKHTHTVLSRPKHAYSLCLENREQTKRTMLSAIATAPAIDILYMHAILYAILTHEAKHLTLYAP